MGTAVPNEELCLKWNDFESILSRSFCEMRDESDFFDVRIACFDDKSTIKTLPAHRVVLSACSPVLKELLRAIGPDGGNKGPLIFLRGIGYHEMEAVLDFMYNGQTKVSHTELDVFLAAAEELKIKGLTTSQEKPSPRKRPAMEATNGTRPSKKKAKNQAVDNVAPGPSTLVEVEDDDSHVEIDDSQMVVKSENLNVDPSGLPMEEENESYYDEGVDEYDNSAYLDESGDFSADSKEYLAMTPSERLQKRKTMITTDPMTGKEMCTICGAQFGASKNLHDHIDSKHLQVYCYSCKFCNKKFTSRGTKYQHESQMHRHHGKVKKVKTPKTETSPLAEIKKEVPEEIEPLLELPPMLPLPPELPPPDSSS